MLITRQTPNLLQIFCEILLPSQVIFKSMKVADDISRETLECEWVKSVIETDDPFKMISLHKKVRNKGLLC